MEQWWERGLDKIFLCKMKGITYSRFLYRNKQPGKSGQRAASSQLVYIQIQGWPGVPGSCPAIGRAALHRQKPCGKQHQAWAVGRKNPLFAASHAAAERAALFYSLFATRKIQAINPYDRLKNTPDRLAPLNETNSTNSSHKTSQGKRICIPIQGWSGA